MMVRVGIIGAGQIVEDAHLPVLKQIREVQVCWLSDVDKTRSRLLSEMYEVPSISTDSVEQRLSEIDVCLIAIPLGARSKYIEACAKSGIAVYIEKPFARSRAEHDYYCSLFPPYAIAAGFQRRFYKTANLIKHIVDGQQLGNLQRIEYSIGQYSLKSGGPRKFITDPLLAGGGLVIDSAIHGLDQIVLATSAERVAVHSVEAVVFDNIDYEASIISELQLQGHKVPTECNATRLRNIRQGFRYYFDKAHVCFGLAPDSHVLLNSSISQDQENVQVCLALTKQHAPFMTASTVNQSFYLFWRTFLQALQMQHPNITSANATRLTTGWIEDIYQGILACQPQSVS